MDLKSFQTGVSTLARYTNQMKKDPDPFMLQVGKDGKLALISGNAGGTVVWRINGLASNIGKYGIDSKLMSQGAKALKGKGVTVEFVVTEKSLVIVSSSGGRLELKFGKLPTIIHRPPTGELQGTLQIGNLDQFARKVGVTDNTRYTGICFEDRGEGHIRVIATDGYIVYEADMVARGKLPDLTVVPMGFWNALRGSTNNGEARFYESGLSVRFSDFEFSTGFVPDVTGYKSWWDNMFPRGQTFDVGFQAKRKDLLAALKAQTPLVTINVNSTGLTFTANPDDRGSIIGTSKRKGTGTNKLVNDNLSKILNAFDGDEVIVSWNKTDKPFYLIRQADVYHECFILAPVVTPT